ncbi:MAG TPA: hypothetical protein VN962_18405, partial [Polyangia bacterium]|nr:hypothetical protein [Polyangia bacterium]
MGKTPAVWLVLAATSAAAGCARPPSSQADVEAAGAIGIALSAATGVTLNAVTYTVSGNGFTKSGSIDTSASPVVNGTVGGIPAGKGYTITLTAAS